ncbi:Rossmann-fold NAD(P)(+)-binding protein [Zopfia rhizophila CBS 207.26]|uniref:Rossmann-fold NAD(P)(+)-binding protein n=1 Tax=Zopfia rhizophila CBS 207.26 TaxID=1314779 RepID=A0A6A6ESC5_9PEZI|nr:Rossmann-fold NAD(P)(+)-binding protein [Zopfia rhizophila CBS 207.26]
MPTTLIFGGSGKVARQLTRILALQSPPHKIYSIVRNPDQVSPLEALGATPIVQSIEDSSVSDLAETLKRYNPDVVVWSAGAGGGDPQRTESVDCDGAIKAMNAVAAAGIKRYIVVSALDMRDRENKPTPEWYDENDTQRSEKLWKVIGRYMKAKLAADIELRTGNSERKLDYTIVRPGGLSDEPGKGTISAGKVHLGTMVSREDVARVVMECMENEMTVGLAFDVVGGDTPIAEAVGKVSKEKIDCFEGFY